MLNRVRTPVTMSRREWFANLVREAGRQVADRAQPLNQATGRAIKAAGAAGLDPEKQFELQNGLYGGRFAAIPVAIKRGLLPIYDRMRQQGLMDAQGQPDPLNAYRKGQRDLEIANARGGARAASAGITDTTKAQEILDQLRTDLGPTKFGELERADLAVQEFVRDTRQLLVAADPDSAGMITQELADMLDDEHPHYNPTLQVKYIDEMSMPPSASGGDRVTQNRNTLKRLADEGGLDDTEPAMSSVIRMRAEVEYAVRRNKVAYAAVETLRADPLLGPYMERKPIIRMEKSVAGDMTALWQQGDRKGAISAFRGGKRELWGLADNAPEPLKRQFAQMEEIIKGDDVPAAGLMATWARKANAPLKWGATTLSVPFQLRNAVRDSINLFIQHGFGPIADLPNQFRNALTKSPEWEEAMRQGGGFESLFNQAPADLEHAILQSGGLLVRNPDDLRNLMDKVWQAKLGMIPLTAAIENAPRLAARKALLKRGMTGEQATLYGYRRVTVDWNRAGAALKQINPFILFANARVQGSLNMGRILRDSNAAKMRLGGLAAVAVAAYFWNKQQPGYADIPDYVKNQSMVFLLPGASQDEQGTWENLKYVAVPLGEWAAFTAPIGMLLEHMEGTDQRGALDLLGQELQLISPGPMPFSDPMNFVGQVLPAPLRSVVEVSTNRRFWSNTPIVPRGMENLPTQEQIAPYTSQGSIFAANLAARLGHPVSPMDLDFLVKENLGGLGTMLLGMSDGLAGKAPDTLPLVGSITSGVYRTYGGQQQQDRYELAGKLQAELANTAVEATKALPAYQQASPQTQRQMLVAAQDELKRATMQAEGITPATAPGQLGLPPKFAGVPAANQRAIDEGISAVTAYMTDPLNKPMPSREQLDNWAQYHGKVDPAYTAAVKARSQSTDSARGAVTQIVNNAPPPAVGSDAEALQRAGAIKAQLDSTARYVNVRTGQAVGTPQQWDQWDQWLSRYNSLPATDPQRRWLPNQTKLRYADQARLLLAMQNQQRLRMSLEDASYQRYYGLGKGLSEEAWQQIRSTPKYKDLPAGSDQQAAARDAFLASYRKLPPRDPRRLQYRLIATRYQRMLNPAYAQIVPTARFVEQYGVGDLSAIETPAA